MTTLRPKDRNLAFFSRITRRGLLLGAGAVGIESRIGVAQTPATKIVHTIRIAPASLEIASGKIIKTTAYNGTVPGPALRLQEGKPVAINVINDSGYPNLIHWHGLYNPSNVDGATEEGSPIIPPGESLLYAFTPRPTGTRWYHSHAMASTAARIQASLDSSLLSQPQATLADTTARSCSPPITGKALGSACRTSVRGRHPTMVWW